ncbi:enoyl-CoA hydratase/isomerase family protein|uniref:Enoyl-CoA hydratase n=1 Tax=Dendrosporobacter quercicolus TaxID=146817 RepID=A0A1G9SMU1_9FIRM|nr:enoyl-CoA hydratase/isomerase family protein [Dendrosporobacter quercicolus]NSL48668.1 enoyl-CoA hydratase/isomerase family protein [Dendrosporobacter quercicolus DSM 1736]SDM36759.1 enoyl-CoA hydratase [Dendrosporobacter quercicolus]
MEESIVLYEKIGRVARIWLNRPKAINALSPELIQGLKDAIDRLSKDEDVRVGIIAGKGEKGFCAGFDLNLSAVLPHNTLTTRRERVAFENELYMKIWNCPKPVIGALHGHVVGGGLFIALSCDMLVAADNTKLGNTEVAYGLNYTEIFPMGVFKLPQNVMREIALTGPAALDVQEMKQYGLFNRVVPFEELEEASLRLALEVTHLSPISAPISKRILNNAYELQQMQAAIHYAEEMFALNRLNGKTEETEAFWAVAKEKSFKEAIKQQRAKQAEADQPVLEYIKSLKNNSL